MIPVILIHKGSDFYLPFVIKQALKNNDVVLISDINPQIDDPKFSFVDMSTLVDEQCNAFVKIYEHLSTNPYGFELFCFLRWFILENYMKKFNRDKVFYIDSDVMLYVNVNDEITKFEQYDLTILHRCAAVSSFITKTGIENFNKFLIKTYSDKNSYAYNKIKSHYDVRQKHNLNGGVCDMTLFEYFHYHSDVGGGPGKVGEMMTIIDDSTYDHNINAEDQYFEYDRIKQFKFIDKVPYCFSKKLNKLIKFNSIHFNSGAKYFIPEYYEK